jgi:small subunit ribosomal protein S11
MGKKRIVKKSGGGEGGAKRSSSRLPKKKLAEGTLYIEATFNNTKGLLTDKQGNAVFTSSSGALGFRGAKKGTPFAATKVGEILGEKAKTIGVKNVNVIIKGVGSGREPLVRAFMAYDIEISGIRDVTPVPHNGPKPKKPRRV